MMQAGEVPSREATRSDRGRPWATRQARKETKQDLFYDIGRRCAGTCHPAALLDLRMPA